MPRPFNKGGEGKSLKKKITSSKIDKVAKHITTVTIFSPHRELKVYHFGSKKTYNQSRIKYSNH